jgi:hypothetical protein
VVHINNLVYDSTCCQKYMHIYTFISFKITMASSRRHQHILHLLGLLALASQIANASTASANTSTIAQTPSPATIHPPPAIEDKVGTIAKNGGGNPIGQLAGYVKDSFLRMKDGSVQLYTNHQRCNEIRAKQREYLAITAATLPETDRKAALKYRTTAGGISYEEYNFLTKGKDDRSKLANVVFMMVFSPNFVPYAFMFFPEMLPSPFAMPAGTNKLGLAHSKWNQISRERSHAVVQTLLDLEKAARVPPMIANLNPFGKGKTRRMMESVDRLGHDIGDVLMAKNGGGSEGAHLVQEIFKDEIYTTEKPNKDKSNLVCLHKAIMTGLGRSMQAPSFNSLVPTFFVRGKVLNNLRVLENADKFLVEHDIDLGSLSPELLQEACSDRLIGGPGRSNDEMVEGLSTWLDLTVKQPEVAVQETGMHYNGNLARAILLCYNVVDGARDGRSSSYLPRLLYQGQLNRSFDAGDGASSKTKWNRFK